MKSLLIFITWSSLAFSSLLLYLKNGSILDILSILYFAIFLFTLILSIKRNKQQSETIIIATLIGISVLWFKKDAMFNYLMNITRTNLTIVCGSIDDYKTNNNNKNPKSLSELVPEYLNKIPKSGFGIIDNNFNYSIVINRGIEIEYRVKSGKCHSHCSSSISMEYTSIICADVQ